MSQCFVGEKEERPVLYDWTTESASELVPLERRRLSRGEVEEVTRVQHIVAEELEEFAVEFVGSRTRCDVNDRAGALPILGAKGRVIQLEFLNAADRRLKADRVEPKIV